MRTRRGRGADARPAPPPGPERRRGEPRNRAPGVHAADREHQLREHRNPQDAVGQPRSQAHQACPSRQPAERVVVHRTQPAAVLAVQHLRPVLRHVDPGGAVARARLAAQAQVEGSTHLVGVHAMGHQRAVGHLLQHAGAATRRVLLVVRGQVGRAHEPAVGGRVGAALAHPDAAVHCGGEVAGVVREREPVPCRDRSRCRSAQVRVQRPRSHHDARVEHVGRVQQILEGREQVDRRGRVHQRQQLAACPAVAVLAGHRPAVRRDQPARVERERPQAPSCRGLVRERDVQPQVHAPITEVPVCQTVHPAGGHQGLELAQVGPEPLGRHGRVLEPGPRGIARGSPAREPSAIRSDPPHRGGLGPRREDARGASPGVGHQSRGAREGLVERVPADLDHQPARTLRQVRYR